MTAGGIWSLEVGLDSSTTVATGLLECSNCPRKELVCYSGGFHRHTGCLETSSIEVPWED